MGLWALDHYAMTETREWGDVPEEVESSQGGGGHLRLALGYRKPERVGDR